MPPNREATGISMAEQVTEASVLFADVSGSTKLYETAGDAVAHAAIEKCVNLMREKTVQATGRVIKTIGDEVMSAVGNADITSSPMVLMTRPVACTVFSRIRLTHFSMAAWATASPAVS